MRGISARQIARRDCNAHGKLTAGEQAVVVIEALAIVFVFCVACGLYLMAVVPANARTASEKIQSLQQHRATLLAQIQRGTMERWDEVMMSQIEEQLRSVESQLGRQLER
jgi:hypothetical protein